MIIYQYLKNIMHNLPRNIVRRIVKNVLHYQYSGIDKTVFHEGMIAQNIWILQAGWRNQHEAETKTREASKEGRKPFHEGAMCI